MLQRSTFVKPQCIGHLSLNHRFEWSWVYFCAISRFPDVFQELREVPGFAGRFPGKIGRSWFEKLKPQDRWLRKSVLTSGNVGNCHFYLRYDRCLRVTTRIWKVNRPVSTCRSRPFLNADAADESGWHIQPFQQCQFKKSNIDHMELNMGVCWRLFQCVQDFPVRFGEWVQRICVGCPSRPVNEGWKQKGTWKPNTYLLQSHWFQFHVHVGIIFWCLDGGFQNHWGHPKSRILVDWNQWRLGDPPF